MSERFVRTRTAGYCDAEFAHDGRIAPGDIVAVETHYPRGEAVSAFNVPPLTRTRRCEWCVLQEQMHMAARGYTTLTLRDRQGDLWTVGADGLMESFETASFPIEHVRRKWGPLTVARPQVTNEGEKR